MDKIDYFIERTDRDLAYLKTRIDNLSSFKWMLLGASIAVSTIAGSIASIVMIYLELKK